MRFPHPARERPAPGSRGAAGARGAFTIVELLAALAIIVLLAALLVPAYQAGTTKVRAAKCAANLRQLFLAATRFTADNNGLSLPVQTGTGSSATFWHWRLRPYLGGTNEYDASVDRKVRCPAYGPSSRPNYWAWGLGMNSKPGYEGAATVPPMDLFNWLQSTPVSWQRAFRQAAITHPSRRLFLCDAVEWQGSPPLSASGRATFPDYHRHGTNRCNVLFYDGHAAPADPATINKALYDPASL